MAINLTNLIDLDGLRAFKNKNDEARANAITEAQTDHDRHFVEVNYASGVAAEPKPGSIMVPSADDVVSGNGTKEDPYIADFTVVYVDSIGENPKYYKNTSSAESSASVASTSDIEALFS